MLTRVIAINNNMDIDSIKHWIWQHNQMLVPLLYVTAQRIVHSHSACFVTV